MSIGTVDNCKIISLNPCSHPLGTNIGSKEFGHLPFRPQRIFYIYDIPAGASRGGHAHKELFQFLIATSGSFDVIVDDTLTKTRFTLNRPDFGLLIPPGIWREMENFSSGSICLVLASIHYKESDYLRDYSEYKEYMINNNKTKPF
jgi:hypothetical protein